MIANPGPKPSRWLRPAAGIAALVTLSAATGWGVASFAGAASGPDTGKVRAALKLRLPKTPIDAINCEGLGGLCEVASKSTLFYVDRAAKYLVIGRVYDMEARQDLTAARLLALHPDLLAAGAARRAGEDDTPPPQRASVPAKISLAGLPASGAVNWGPAGGRRANTGLTKAGCRAQATGPGPLSPRQQRTSTYSGALTIELFAKVLAGSCQAKTRAWALRTLRSVKRQRIRSNRRTWDKTAVTK
jgi:hypothetical protein